MNTSERMPNDQLAILAMKRSPAGRRLSGRLLRLWKGCWTSSHTQTALQGAKHQASLSWQVVRQSGIPRRFASIDTLSSQLIRGLPWGLRLVGVHPGPAKSSVWVSSRATCLAHSSLRAWITLVFNGCSVSLRISSLEPVDLVVYREIVCDWETGVATLEKVKVEFYCKNSGFTTSLKELKKAVFIDGRTEPHGKDWERSMSISCTLISC